MKAHEIEINVTEFVQMLNELINDFYKDYGKLPQGLVLGVEPAQVLMAHLIQKGFVTSERPEFKYRGIPIHICTFGSIVAVTLDMEDVYRYQTLLEMQSYENEMSLTKH